MKSWWKQLPRTRVGPLLLAVALGLVLSLLPLLSPLAGRSAAPSSSPPAGPSDRPEIRGVWLTGNDMATLRDRPRMQAAVAQLAQLNFNTLYPVVWNGSLAYYPSAVMEQRNLQSFRFQGLQQQDTLAELIAEGHRQGLLVIPWFEFGFMVPPDSPLAQRHPDWLSQQRDGSRTSVSAAGEVAWLNPFHPEVQRLITELVLEIVDGYDGDGVQFDDHMSLPSSFGYDPFTSALYRRETGQSPPANPQDGAWVKWRADRISGFMAQLHAAMDQRRAGLILSVSPNYYDFAYKLQLQDWLGWVRRGIADEVLVQLYRPDLASFSAELERPELQQSRAATGIGVMSGQRQRPVAMELIESQVQAARERGLGVAFFYFESLWNLGLEPAEERQARLARLFSQPAVRQGPVPRSRGPAPTPPSLPPEPLPLPPPPPPPAMPTEP